MAKPKQVWDGAYRALMGRAPKRHIGSLYGFASRMCETPYAFEASWKATTEGLAEDLCDFLDLDYDIGTAPDGAVLIRVGEAEQTATLNLPEDVPTTSVMAAVARLLNIVCLSITPVNDGDDLWFLMLSREKAETLLQSLGSYFNDVFEEV
jgi:hypothetical protein